MSQFIALGYNNKGQLLQTFGPYKTREDAEAGIERLEGWPALRVGEWDIQELYPDPETKPVNTTTVTYTYAAPSVVTYTSPNYLPNYISYYNSFVTRTPSYVGALNAN